MLAGKYGPLIGAATGAVLGAGGSLLGNAMDNERGEGPLRLGMEALNAASLAAIPGFVAGLAPRARALGKQNAIDAIRAASKARRSGDAVAADAAKISAKQAVNSARTLPATLAIGGGLAVPVAAGIGGLAGGGGADIYNAIGIPGMQQGINPESYGSSNLQYV